ncbi:F-box domain [Dillenia turbinata]|uniref:F-box domain n=1 Tax=Dillenia turbinata TaxID=194707 RepID=A0AAN8W334_9MAGN
MGMLISQGDGMLSLSSDLLYDILRHLDGPTLASAACACVAFCSISKDEKLWENACASLWPSTNRDDVKKLIMSIEAEYYGDMNEFESMLPSDFVSIVDFRYTDKIVRLIVLWGIPNANGVNGIDLLNYSARDDDSESELEDMEGAHVNGQFACPKGSLKLSKEQKLRQSAGVLPPIL